MAHNERRHFHERGKSSTGLIKPSEPRRTRGATFARNVGANILIEKKKKKEKKGRKNESKNERGSAAQSFSNLREHEPRTATKSRGGGGGGRDSIKGELCTLCVTVGFLWRRFLNEARRETRVVKTLL